MPKSGSKPPVAAVKKRRRGHRDGRFSFSTLCNDLLDAVPKAVARIIRLVIAWAGRKSRWVRVPLYGALALGGVIYWFGDSLGQLPGVHFARDELGYLWENLPPRARIPTASGRQFAVLVARIDGDHDDSVKESLHFALDDVGVESLRIERRLRTSGEERSDEPGAKEIARRWLEASQADLLIWGQVSPRGEHVRLIMTPRNASQDGRVTVPRSDLDVTFLSSGKDKFNAVIEAQVLGVLAQFNPSHLIAPQLRSAINRLQGVVQKQNDAAIRATLLLALANAKAILGEQAGDIAVLEEAVQTYQKLIDDPPPKKIECFRARAQNNLGNALWSLGNLSLRDEGSLRWEKAVGAYGAALEEYQQEQKPQDSAVTQNNRGLALQSLGRLDEALADYRAALATLTQEKAPSDWAMVQNNLGNALVDRGERDRSATGTTHLLEAVTVFQEALDVRHRAKMPLSWAMTQNNLGNALSTLGERENGISGSRHLNAAIAAYHEALKEYTVNRVSLARDRAMTQNNLGVALTILGEREKNAEKLTEAVTKLRASLEVREKSPRACAPTQKNLGNALFSLGRIETDSRRGTARLNEAVMAYRAAIEQYAKLNEPLEKGITYNALGVALRELDDRENKRERTQEATRAFELALGVPELRASEYRDIVQNNLWAMLDRNEQQKKRTR